MSHHIDPTLIFRRRRVVFGPTASQLLPRNLLADFDTEYNNTIEYRLEQLKNQTVIEIDLAHECSICYDDLTPTNVIQLSCTHYYCNTCIRECMMKQHNKCAMCRAPM